MHVGEYFQSALISPKVCPSSGFSLCCTYKDDVKFTAVSIQKRLLTLKQCRELLDMLISEAETGKKNSESLWYKNQFVKDYISTHSEKLSDPDLTSGVIKIQNMDGSNMNQQEEEDCVRLLINNNDASSVGP